MRMSLRDGTDIRGTRAKPRDPSLRRAADRLRGGIGPSWAVLVVICGRPIADLGRSGSPSPHGQPSVWLRNSIRSRRKRLLSRFQRLGPDATCRACRDAVRPNGEPSGWGDLGGGFDTSTPALKLAIAQWHRAPLRKPRMATPGMTSSSRNSLTLRSQRRGLSATGRRFRCVRMCRCPRGRAASTP
jgi:hypothetical protein